MRLLKFTLRIKQAQVCDARIEPAVCLVPQRDALHGLPHIIVGRHLVALLCRISSIQQRVIKNIVEIRLILVQHFGFHLKCVLGACGGIFQMPLDLLLSAGHEIQAQERRIQHGKRPLGDGRPVDRDQCLLCLLIMLRGGQQIGTDDDIVVLRIRCGGKGTCQCGAVAGLQEGCVRIFQRHLVSELSDQPPSPEHGQPAEYTQQRGKEKAEEQLKACFGRIVDDVSQSRSRSDDEKQRKCSVCRSADRLRVLFGNQAHNRNSFASVSGKMRSAFLHTREYSFRRMWRSA